MHGVSVVVILMLLFPCAALAESAPVDIGGSTLTISGNELREYSSFAASRQVADWLSVRYASDGTAQTQVGFKVGEALRLTGAFSNRASGSYNLECSPLSGVTLGMHYSDAVVTARYVQYHIARGVLIGVKHTDVTTYSVSLSF